MAETAPDYSRGEQNVSAQVSTYRLFNNLAMWAALHLAVIILVCALWFCVGLGFLAGLIPGVIVFAAGVWFIRSQGRAREHQVNP